MPHKQRKIWLAVFAAYSLLMLWLLFARQGYDSGVPYPDQLRFNLLPFETISRYIRHLTHSDDPGILRHAFINLVGNVVMFIPLGLLLPVLWQQLRALWKTVLVTAGIIAAVEVTQLLTLVGSCDTDDLILNVLGAAVGYGLFRLFSRKQSIA